MTSERVAFFLCGVAAVLFCWCVREVWRQVQTVRLRRYCQRVLEQSRAAVWN